MAVTFLLWHCPLCDLGDGDGDGEVDPRCLHCHGFGLTDDIAGWENDARPAPRPPAVMAKPCPDCAFRPGSLERETDRDFATVSHADRPFYCHQGMPLAAGAYSPAARSGDVPIGYKVCCGWWDWATTQRLPTKPYREMVDPE